MTTPIIDTHQHLWDLSQFPYSWCRDIPGLNRTFKVADYLDAIAGIGVQKSVFVECDVDEPHAMAEARHVLSLTNHPDNPIAGVVASCRPEQDDFAECVDQLAGHPNLKGFRRVLHNMPDETSQTPSFAPNVRRLADHGLSFDLCVQARQLPLALRLAEQCPDVQFILDHCGVPDVKGRRMDPWRDYIKQIGQLPHVACKISGLVAYADPEHWTVEDLRPFYEHVVDCFGWDRVMWGSDWPVCTLSATYQQWVDAALELTKKVTERDRKRLFHDNAERVYRLG